jgi:hypothetical protein
VFQLLDLRYRVAKTNPLEGFHKNWPSIVPTVTWAVSEEPDIQNQSYIVIDIKYMYSREERVVSWQSQTNGEITK